MRKTVLVQNSFCSFTENWIKYLKEYGAFPEPADLTREPAGVVEKLRECHGVMWHIPMKPSFLQAADPILVPAEICLGKKVFPNYRTRWHFENKFAQKYLFDALGVRTPATYCFWDRASAMEWIQSRERFPLVCKKGTGAGSVNVGLIRNRREAEKLISEAFSPHGLWYQKGYFLQRGSTLRRLRNLTANGLLRVADSAMHLFTGRMPRLPRGNWLPEKDRILFQEYLPDNRFDTRITVIGDRAFGFRRFNRDNDFRASGGGRLDYTLSEIDDEMIRIAFEVSRRGGFQSMAYDFLRAEDRAPVICEMSYGYQNLAVYNCKGHWDSALNWQGGQMWPEEAHVKDFLEIAE